MCDPVSATMAALSIAGAGAGLVGQAQSIEAQAHSVNRQAARAYTENAYNFVQDARMARDEGYTAEMTKRAAMGAARVKGSTLGIRGHTANELVSNEAQVGNYNVQVAKDRSRAAGAAYHLGTKKTQGAATDKINDLDASMPSAFAQIVTGASAGISGYMLGSDLKGAMKPGKVS